MSFLPIVPAGGIAGWAMLGRVRPRLQAASDRSPAIQRDTEYFSAKIGSVTSARELVSDRRLLSVALGAFGLEGDISNKAFIEKVLSDGTMSNKALANRLSDSRYFDLSKAFGFGDFSTPNTVKSDFADKIVSAYRERRFEAALGRQTPNLRIASSFERELTSVLSRQNTADGSWFSVMGTPPVRRVFEQALGLPQSLGRLDLDTQLRTFRAKTERVFGNGEVAQFSDPDKRERLIRLFLARSGTAPVAGGQSSAPRSAAVALLAAGGAPTGLLGTLQ